MRLRLAFVMLLIAAGVARAQSEDVVGLLAPMPEPTAKVERVELRGDGAVGLDAAGQVVWTVPHASLGDDGAKTPPAVVMGDRAVYAIRGDLMQVEAATGVVAARTRFPAVIDDLSLAKDGALEVRLRDSERGGASVDVVRYRLGQPAPGRGSTDAIPWSASSQDAGRLVPGWDGGSKAFDVDKIPVDLRDAALAALASAAERDPTNPHYRLLEGQLVRAAGRADDAAIAFTAAAATPAAAWTDLLHVWTRLEELGVPAAATQAYDRAIAGMKAQGVRPDRQRAVLAIAPYVPRLALEAALEAGDAARVDALSTRLWQLAPHVEGGRWVWAQLAAWLDTHDRALAETWRARAAEGGRMIGLTGADDVDLDGWASGSAGFLVAIPIVALLIGLRRGAAARTTPVQFPYVQLVDLIALLLPLIPAIYGRMQVNDAMSTVSRSAAAPVPLFSDAVDAETVSFVERELVESGARTELLTYLKAELDALRAGGRSDAAPFDLDRTLPDALAAHPPLGTRLRQLDDGFEGLSGEQQVPTPSIPGALGLGLVLFLLGFAVAKRKPGVRVLAQVIPGGAGPLWAFGGLVTAAMTCAIYAWAWDPWFGTLAPPAFDKMFGLGELPDLAAPASPTPWWPFAALVGAIAAQAAAAWYERRRA